MRVYDSLVKESGEAIVKMVFRHNRGSNFVLDFRRNYRKKIKHKKLEKSRIFNCDAMDWAYKVGGKRFKAKLMMAKLIL